jgi:hypothetical protein
MQMGVVAPGQPPPNPGLELAKTRPIVQIVLSPHTAIAQQLHAQGVTNPPVVTGNALIDTGAGMTCVDLQALATLGAPVVGQIQVSSATHAATTLQLYPIHLQVAGMTITMDAPTCIGAPLTAQGLRRTAWP